MSLYDKKQYFGYGMEPVDDFNYFDYEDVKRSVNELHSRLKLKANKQQCLTHDDIREIFGEFKDE